MGKSHRHGEGVGTRVGYRDQRGWLVVAQKQELKAHVLKYSLRDERDAMDVDPWLLSTINLFIFAFLFLMNASNIAL